MDCKYKVGDKIRIKSWEQMAKEFGIIEKGAFKGHIRLTGGVLFREEMKGICGTVQTIEYLIESFGLYEISDLQWWVSDDMIASLVEYPPLREPTGDKIVFTPAEKDNYEIHKELCLLLNDVYVSKNHDYGNTFGKGFKEYGLMMPVMRLEDKFNRFKQLVTSSEQHVKDESIEDTLLDLANYALMTVTEMRMKNDRK